MLKLTRALIAAQTGFIFSADDIHFDLFPPRVHIIHPTVHRLGKAPFFRAQSIDILPGIARNWSGKIAFAWFAVRSPDIQLTLNSEGVIEELKPLRSPHIKKNTRIPLELSGLLVTRARLVINMPGRALIEIPSLSVFARPSARGGIPVKVAMAPVSLDLPQRHLVITQTALEFSVLHGDLLAPREIEVKSLRFISNSAALTSAGNYAFDHQSGNGDLNLNVDLSLVSLFFPHLPHLEGRLNTQIHLSMKRGEPKLTTTLDASNLKVDGIAVGNIEIESTFSEDDIDIHQLILSVASGRATLTGHIDPTGQIMARLKVAWENLELAEILDRVGVKNPWIILPSDGGATLSGYLHPKVTTQILLNGPAHVDVLSFTSRDRSFRLDHAKSYLQLHHVAVDGKLSLYRDHLDFTDAHLRGEPGHIGCDARFYFNQKLGFHIKGGFDKVNLQSFGKIAGVNLKGIGTIGFDLGGPYGPPSIDATVALKDAAVEDIKLGDLNSRVYFQDHHTLEFAESTAKLGNSPIQVEGWLDLLGTPHLLFNGKVNHGEATDLHSFIPLSPQFVSHLHGDVNGDFRVSGHAAAPDVKVNFNSDAFSVLGQPLNHGIAKIDVMEGQLRSISAAADIQQHPVIFEFHRQPEGLSFTAQASDVPLEKLEWLQTTSKRQTGQLNAKIKGIVTKTISAAGDLNIKNFRVGGSDKKSEFNGSLKIDKDVLHLWVSGFNGTLSGEATARLDGHIPLTAQIKANKLSLSYFENLPENYRAILSATLTLQGNWNDLDHLKGDGLIHEFSLAAGRITAHTLQPADFTLNSRVFTLHHFDLAGGDTHLNLQGSLALSGELRAELIGQIDSELLRPLLPHVESMGGILDFRLHLAGKSSAPKLNGRVEMKNLRLKFDFFDPVFEPLTGVMEFTGHVIDFIKLKAGVGGGNVTGLGTLSLDGGEIQTLSLTLNVDDVTYTTPFYLIARVFGRMHVDLSEKKAIRSRRGSSGGRITLHP